MDTIWIYNVANRAFRKSIVRCPIMGRFQAFTICDKNNDQLAVFGYIRSEWTRSEIDEHLFPLEYLIRIMGKYYFKEDSFI